MTPKQEQFVMEYLVDLNAKQAAIRAGYSPKTAEVQASRLLSNVKVSEAVARAQAERKKRTGVDQDMVIEDLLRIAQKAEKEERFGDALKALEMLGKHVGLFSDTVDLNVRTPPALHVHFTKPRQQIAKPDKTALQEGFKTVGKQCQSLNPTGCADGGGEAWG